MIEFKTMRNKLWHLLFLFFFNVGTGAFHYSYGQETPVYKMWKEGDWWEIKIHQRADYMRIDDPPWIEFGTWKFTVMTVTDGEVIIHVSDLDKPETERGWDLTLRYSSENGVLEDVNYAVLGKRYSKDSALLYMPVGSAFFIVGHSIDMLKSASTVKERDVITEEMVEFNKIEMEQGKAFQLWRAGDPWWRYYASRQSFPIKAELIKTSWWGQ